MTTVLTEAAGGGMMYSTLIWVVAMIAIVYFLMIRPQKKEQNRMNAMLSQLEIGDSIIIDITDDTVIVEFGNNKNCRIPMQKTAISQVEKPQAE